MVIFKRAYTVYVEKCEQFGLQPVNFHYYVNQLSHEQLLAFNHYSTEQEGNEYD